MIAHAVRGLASLAMNRRSSQGWFFSTAGYHHIFVGVQGWRLLAVKCYLRLGFVPLLHTDELLPRWRRVCEQIEWPVREAEWPRSLAPIA